MQKTTPRDNRPVLSVSELNRQARITIEQRFDMVWVTGELSNFARPRSGHWYFTLKDDQAQVRCAMFVNRNRHARIQPGDGQQVLVRGRVSLYEGRGDFQVIVDQMEPAGEGALRQAFDALKLKLDAEGLFALERKVNLPRFPKHVAVISSATGAAFHDIIAVWRRRFPALRVTLIPSDVQGIDAEPQLLAAIARLAELDPDVAIVTRGGGSLEDLWAFNLESVARAVSACHVPVVSAIGHEIDVTIVDFVADARAPTPSAAAELTVPSRDELVEVINVYKRDLVGAWQHAHAISSLTLRNLALRLTSPRVAVEQAYQRTDDVMHRIQLAALRRVGQSAESLNSLSKQLQLLGPLRQISQAADKLQGARSGLADGLSRSLDLRQSKVSELARMLSSVSPLPTLKRGYAIVRDTASNAVVESVRDVSTGQSITAQLADGTLLATVNRINTEAQLEDPMS